MAFLWDFFYNKTTASCFDDGEQKHARNVCPSIVPRQKHPISLRFPSFWHASLQVFSIHLSKAPKEHGSVKCGLHFA
jgi:hypothetical protein